MYLRWQNSFILSDTKHIWFSVCVINLILVFCSTLVLFRTRQMSLPWKELLSLHLHQEQLELLINFLKILLSFKKTLGETKLESCTAAGKESSARTVQRTHETILRTKGTMLQQEYYRWKGMRTNTAILVATDALQHSPFMWEIQEIKLTPLTILDTKKNQADP